MDAATFIAEVHSTSTTEEQLLADAKQLFQQQPEGWVEALHELADIHPEIHRQLARQLPVVELSQE